MAILIFLCMAGVIFMGFALMRWMPESRFAGRKPNHASYLNGSVKSVPESEPAPRSGKILRISRPSGSARPRRNPQSRDMAIPVLQGIRFVAMAWCQNVPAMQRCERNHSRDAAGKLFFPAFRRPYVPATLCRSQSTTKTTRMSSIQGRKQI